jgi:S1-C subfamily serine protease
VVAAAAGTAVAAGLVFVGAAIATGQPGSVADDVRDGAGLTSVPDGYGRGSGPGAGLAPTRPGGTSSGTGTASLDVTDATDAQSQGVVLISTVLGYQSAEAAGTGLVLTSDGLVITNNHVVEGSTTIQVTIASTGETYAATVVGTDATSDVAVLQLTDASGLTVANLDDDGDASAAAGDAVTAVGNAEGGGTLLAASGSVTALDQTITTSSEGATQGETLDGLIEINADVVSGDSGGPLYDDDGEVIGITTAASSGSSDITGYAIPIDDFLTVADQIIAGQETDTNTIGYPAFLGVELATVSSTSGISGGTGMPGGITPGGITRGGTSGGAGATATAGATVGAVIDGTPAATSGLTAGDTITAVDGTAVGSGDELSSVLGGHAPGDSVTITWTDTAGSSRTATVTLIAGPAA